MPCIRLTLRRRAVLILATTLTMIFAGDAARSSAEEQPRTYLLRYRFTPGVSIHYTAENQSKIEIQKDQTEQHVEHSEIAGKHYRVLAADEEGNGVLEFMIDHVRMSVSVDGVAPITYDSETDEVPPAAFTGIANTIGQPLARIKVAPTGEVRDVNWLIPGGKEDAANHPKPSTDDILMRLPEEPVAIDGVWKEKFETEVALDEHRRKDVTLMRTYRLLSVEDGRANIELKTAVITPIHDPALEAQLIQKSPEGTIEFDLDRGMLISRTTDLDREVVGFNGQKSRIRNITTKSERFERIERRASGSDAISTAAEPSPPKQ